MAREIPYDEDLVFQLSWNQNRIQEAFEHFYALPKPPTALFTSNDFIAYEFINYVEARGMRIPEDLSVIGHGNIDRYSAREFLTSVDQPFELVGKSAAKLLLKRIENHGLSPQGNQHIVLPAPLIIRSSTSALTY
jgi:DNA-binding LacI/PurR family transcriptional regulator